MYCTKRLPCNVYEANQIVCSSWWASLLKTRFVFNCMKGLSSFFFNKIYYEFAFKFIKSIKEHVCWNNRIHVLSLGVSKVGGHLCPPPPHSGTWMHVCSHVHARRHPIEAENMLHTMYTHGTSAHGVSVCVLMFNRCVVAWLIADVAWTSGSNTKYIAETSMSN